MKKMVKKSSLSIILWRTIGFIIFIILLLIANILVSSFPNDVYGNIIQFFNVNIILFLLIFFIGMTNEIFWNFCFPFNLVAPFISSVLSIFIVTFLYRIWEFVNSYLNLAIVVPIYAIYILVAIIVFISSYVIIMVRGGEIKEVYEEEKMHKRKTKETKINWKDIKEEFRLVLYNIANALNRKLEGGKKRKGKK